MGGIVKAEIRVAKFWARIDRSGGAGACWPVVKGALSPDGYGRACWRWRPTSTHRLAWELTNGPIPTGLFVLHRCDNPPCCNPAHLFLGTQAENMTDMAAKGRAPRGSTHANAKLDEERVAEIRRAIRAGETTRAVASRYGVTQSNVALIARGAAWRHV